MAQQVLAEFVQQGPSEAELKAAKDNLIDGFALLTDSNAKLLAQIGCNPIPVDFEVDGGDLTIATAVLEDSAKVFKQ